MRIWLYVEHATAIASLDTTAPLVPCHVPERFVSWEFDCKLHSFPTKYTTITRDDRRRDFYSPRKVLDANATLVSTVIEALASLAEASGPGFGEAFLRRALYPLLEKVGPNCTALTIELNRMVEVVLYGVPVVNYVAAGVSFMVDV